MSCRSTLIPLCASTLLVVAAAGLPAYAQPAGPEDWPCIQVLVPEVMAGVLWPRPLDPALSEQRSNDTEAMALGEQLGEREQFGPDVITSIDRFVADVPEDDLAERLDAVAERTVGVVNQRRSRYIDGIRRFTQQQIVIADQIEGTLNELAVLDDGTAADPSIDRAAVEETLLWHERLYDQRERMIRALCEQPVQLEQTLSSTIRELASRLPAS